MTEWSKVLRSGRSVFARVGSSPTACIFPFSFLIDLLYCYTPLFNAQRLKHTTVTNTADYLARAVHYSTSSPAADRARARCLGTWR